MVGCLVGLREADLIEDDELLQGCLAQELTSSDGLASHKHGQERQDS